jgi:hypothetical protein
LTVRHIARPALQANGFQQSAQIASCPLIEVEVVSIGLPCQRKIHFQSFQGLRGVEWAIFIWIMPESCAFPRFFALRARLEIAMILDGKN